MTTFPLVHPSCRFQLSSSLYGGEVTISPMLSSGILLIVLTASPVMILLRNVPLLEVGTTSVTLSDG